MTIIKTTELKSEMKAKLKFIKNFNKEAKKLKIKHRMSLHHNRFVHLYGILNPFWFNFWAKQIFYSEIYNSFRFIDSINEKLYKKIKPILDNIPESFEMEYEK